MIDDQPVELTWVEPSDRPWVSFQKILSGARLQAALRAVPRMTLAEWRAMHAETWETEGPRRDRQPMLHGDWLREYFGTWLDQ